MLESRCYVILPFSPTAEPGFRLICIFHYRTILDASKLIPWLRGFEIALLYLLINIIIIKKLELLSLLPNGQVLQSRECFPGALS